MKAWVLQIGSNTDHSIDAEGVYRLGEHKFGKSGDDIYPEARRRAEEYIKKSGLAANIRFYCVSMRTVLSFDAVGRTMGEGEK